MRMEPCHRSPGPFPIQDCTSEMVPAQATVLASEVNNRHMIDPEITTNNNNNNDYTYIAHSMEQTISRR